MCRGDRGGDLVWNIGIGTSSFRLVRSNGAEGSSAEVTLMSSTMQTLVALTNVQSASCLARGRALASTHGPQQRAMSRRCAGARSARPIGPCAEAEAAAIVDRWNAQLARKRAPQFSPTIGAALNAGKPWLRLVCLGYAQQYEVDLRQIVRPRDYPIAALRAAMVCESACRGEGPQPTLLRLHEVPYDRGRVTRRDRA